MSGRSEVHQEDPANQAPLTANRFARSRMMGEKGLSTSDPRFVPDESMDCGLPPTAPVVDQDHNQPEPRESLENNTP